MSGDAAAKFAEGMMINTFPNESDPNPAGPGEGTADRDAMPPAGQATPGAAEGAERTVHDVIAALQAEVSDFKDKWLRAHAEIENVRKRAEREKEDIA